ncbi:MAG TPA: glutathione binding-like protein, partial [Polyangiaceae bacterium]
LVTDDGKVLVESRDICEALLVGEAGAKLVPAPLEGPIWGYTDFADGALEDVMFRIASPAMRDGWKSPSDRALYVLIKERKFGAGCVTAWERDRDVLVKKARHLLEPTLKTLKQRPFVFGERPTLADAALYGLCAMLEESDPKLLARVASELEPYMRRVEGARPKAA